MPIPTKEVIKMTSGSAKESETMQKNDRLVHHIARKFYRNSAMDYEDILQIGRIGLLKSIRTYDPQKAKFATYAYACIKNEIRMQMRKIQNIPPTTSFGDAINAKDEDLTYSEVIASRDQDPLDQIIANDDLLRLFRAIISLKERDQIIVASHIAEVNQNATAAEVGLSQSYVSRFQRRFFKDYATAPSGTSPKAKNNLFIDCTTVGILHISATIQTFGNVIVELPFDELALLKGLKIIQAISALFANDTIPSPRL